MIVKHLLLHSHTHYRCNNTDEDENTLDSEIGDNMSSVAKGIIKDIMSSLVTIEDWSGLGMSLGIPRPKLREILLNFSHLDTPLQAAAKVIQVWMEGSKTPTWQTLMGVLLNMGFKGFDPAVVEHIKGKSENS